MFNDIGEDFWGSSRFKSPEEYQLNAEITMLQMSILWQVWPLPLLVEEVIKAMKNGKPLVYSITSVVRRWIIALKIVLKQLVPFIVSGMMQINDKHNM